jgi:hypothetical protein
MTRSSYRTEISRSRLKRRSGKYAGRRRKRAAIRPGTKFTIKYFRKGKRTKTLTFDLVSFEHARKVARIAGEFADAEVHSFTITAADGTTETWSYRNGRWREQCR